MKNYYKILGVPETASPEEIKKAYKKLALQYHPDRNNDNTETTQKFKEATEAYETLTKGVPARRQVYENDIFNDFLRDFFGETYRPPFVQDPRERLKDYAEHLKEQQRIWIEERKKKKETLSQRQNDLESIIVQKEQARRTATIIYQCPALGTALGSGVLFYADQIEYGMASGAVAGVLTLIAYLVKRPIKQELKYLCQEHRMNTAELEGMAMVDDLVEEFERKL